jgi:hypothetical protein
MKNMTPVILGLLMLTSFFAGVDFHELEEEVVIEETGARAGADPTVIAITTPKETTCGETGCRNAIQVGEATTFSAFIQNAGDSDAEELSYSVTVYMTDSSRAVGGIAKDASGNDLVWENLEVMCDDGTICDFDSTTDPLVPGGYLGGGKLLLQRAGSPITWSPTVGEYMIEVKVASPTDADFANNAELVYVVVEDWYDIEVDLAWTTGDNEDVLDASSVSAGEFTLSVTANGSQYFAPRDVAILLTVSGDVSTATAGGEDLTANGGITTIIAGVDATVRTFEHVEDVNNTTSATRAVLDYQTTWELNGELVPTGASNARFEMSAEILDHTVFGQYTDCEEVVGGGQDDEGNETTLRHFCEVSASGDDRPKTDFDEITGTTDVYDDIRISRMGVYQGYDSSCADGTVTGAPSTFTQEGTGADLNVGCSLVYVDVEHRGSKMDKGYGWNVSYSITHDVLGLVDSGTVNECLSGTDMPYSHQPLGGLGALVGSACVGVSLEPGEYTFDFTLKMNTMGSDEHDSIPWDAAATGDARLSNNEATMVSDVLNNLPLITSFELVTEGDVVVGQESPLQFSVTAFDVDDPSGNTLSFAYNYQGGAIGGCAGTQAEGATVCTTPVLGEFIGNLVVTVVVTDDHSGQVSEEMDLIVWNNAVASATSDAGITIQYPLQYLGITEFSITNFADADASSYDAVQLEGFTGTYGAVAALDYEPSTTFTANDVLSQSVSVLVDKGLEATSLWYIDSSGKWVLFADQSTDVDASTEMFTYNIPANSPVVPAGKMILMGGELAQATIPGASVSGFNAAAQARGAIALNWDITGSILASDNIVVTICEGAGDCESPFTQNVADEDRSFTYSGSSTTHGVTYNITVAVCNEQGCSNPGIGEVVADKQVDGDYTIALEIGVASDGASWDLSWTVTGDTSDVMMWHVCWMSEDFTAANMPMPCPDSTPLDTTTLNIAMPDSIRNGLSYYFTVVGMDDKGNMDASDWLNEAQDTRTADTSNTNDGNGTIGDTGDDASSEVPVWTWGLIGGVVIVAFVAGAFILSRGDGEDGEGKDWDY